MGAEHVILLAGLQKIVPDMDEARRHLREHSLPMENVRAQGAYGQAARLNKTLEIYGDQPGRIHLVLIRRASATESSVASGHWSNEAWAQPTRVPQTL